MENWAEKISPLLHKYGNKRHPLNYENRYQLLVAVVLAAQTTDNLINMITPEFFRNVPSIEVLKTMKPEDLHPYLSKVIGFRKKSEWLVKIEFNR
jgi:endonuclease-3